MKKELTILGMIIISSISMTAVSGEEDWDAAIAVSGNVISTKDLKEGEAVDVGNGAAGKVISTEEAEAIQREYEEIEAREARWNISDDGKLTFNKDATEINEMEFNGNLDIISADIPSNITEIGKLSFANCIYMSEINISDGITTIPESMLYGNEHLKKVRLPQTLTNIEAGAFCNDFMLQKIDIPQNVTEIGESAFSGCGRLLGIVLPDNMEKLGARAFFANHSLKYAVLPSNIDVIAESAFAYCTALNEIQIPDGVTKIENNAFNNCSVLSSVYIPESVTEIGDKAFFPENPKIFGFSGSYAEEYAKAEGLKFETVDKSMYTECKEALIKEINDIKEQPIPKVSVINNKGDITISTDKGDVIFTDAKPFIDKSDRVQIPVRALSEFMGYDVDYKAGNVFISSEGYEVHLTIGQDTITVVRGNVFNTRTMDTTAQIINDRTYIPIRYIAEALGYEVEWK